MGEEGGCYWIYGKDGGVLVQVIHDKDTEFSLEGWNAEGIPEDENGKKQKAIKELVDAMNATKALPTIKTDEGEALKHAEEKEGAIVVKINKEGAYRFEDRDVTMEDLVDVLKAAVMKLENKEPVIEPVLHIRAEREVGESEAVQLMTLSFSWRLSRWDFPMGSLAEPRSSWLPSI